MSGCTTSTIAGEIFAPPPTAGAGAAAALTVAWADNPAIGIEVLDALWGMLPHANGYDRRCDSRYWEYRVAQLLGGAVIGAGNTGRERHGGDVEAGGLVLEIKAAQLVQTHTGRRGFRFVHLRGVRQKDPEDMTHKEADLLVLVGVCPCEDSPHYWVGPYAPMATHNRCNSVALSCPHRAQRQLPTNVERLGLVHPITEADLRAWVERYRSEHAHG